MEGNVWRPAHLTPEQMEERRLTAAVLLRRGRLSQAEIARQLGVSRASVSRWAATLAQQGLDPTVDLAGADLPLAARQTPAIPHDEFGHRTMNSGTAR